MAFAADDTHPTTASADTARGGGAGAGCAAGAGADSTKGAACSVPSASLNSGVALFSKLAAATGVAEGVEYVTVE